MGFIEEELAAVRSEIRDIPYTELVTCYPAMVQVRVRLAQQPSHSLVHLELTLFMSGSQTAWVSHS